MHAFRPVPCEPRTGCSAGWDTVGKSELSGFLRAQCPESRAGTSPQRAPSYQRSSVQLQEDFAKHIRRLLHHTGVQCN